MVAILQQRRLPGVLLKVLCLSTLCSFSAATVEDAAVEKEGVEADSPTSSEPVQIATVSINLQQQDGGSFEAAMTVYDGEDASLAAFRFGEHHGLKDPKELMNLIAKMDVQLEAAKYTPPLEITHCGKRACSAGKLRKRAEENRKVDLYDGMGADLLRALQKKGLEEQVRERLLRELSSAFQGVSRQREREHEEMLHQEELERRRQLMEEAMEEARQRKMLDDEDWALFELGRAVSEEDETPDARDESSASTDSSDDPFGDDNRDIIAETTLKITRNGNDNSDNTETNNNNNKAESETVTATMYEDEDPITAAHRFCVENNIHSHDEVLKIADMLKKEAGSRYSPANVEENCQELIDIGRKHANAGQFDQAGVTYARALHVGGEDDQEILNSIPADLATVMSSQSEVTRVTELFRQHNYSDVLKVFEENPFMLRNNSLRLMKAKCNQQLGNTANVIIDTAHVIERSASYSPWKRGQPRMMAVTLGANAAMEIGADKKALKFYQTVLKFDPDQKQVRAQYRGLKKVTKLLKQADDQLEQGYNNQAMKLIDECLDAVRGLDVDSPVFRSNVQLKLCSVQSKLRKYEEALENCDAVVELREKTAEVSGMFLDPKFLGDAYLKRAEALMEDDDYDEAVQDFRAALERTSDNTRHEVQGRLQEAERRRDAWNGGKKDHYHNDHNGFPNGAPPQRDNIKILQLPVNLSESPVEVRCKWLKKQYKKMALKWHPDKYKGNKKRGSRKMREANDAKELLAKEWGCKGGRGR